MQDLQKGNLKSTFWAFSHLLPEMCEGIEGLRKKISLKRVIETLCIFPRSRVKVFSRGLLRELLISRGWEA